MSKIHAHLVKCEHQMSGICHFSSRKEAMEHAKKFDGKYIGVHEVETSKYKNIVGRFVKEFNHKPNLDVNNIIFDSKCISIGAYHLGYTDNTEDAVVLIQYLKFLNQRKFQESA